MVQKTRFVSATNLDITSAFVDGQPVGNEGRYEQSERLVQRLLGIDRELVTVEGRGIEAPAERSGSQEAH
jgi:hypothetical protein